jgi:hypothetical protein
LFSFIFYCFYIIINIHCTVEAVSKALFRHCERSEAIHKSLLMNWIASVFDLAMTVKRAFDTPSTSSGRRAESPAVSSTGQRPVSNGDLRP